MVNALQGLIARVIQGTFETRGVGHAQRDVRCTTARWLCATVIAIGGLTLIGWEYDLSLLKGFSRRLVAMNPTTAVALVLGAISLHILSPQSPTSAVGRHLAHFGAALVVVIGLLRVGSYVVGSEVPIDQVLYATALELEHGMPNRMAPNTALGLLLVGFALLTLNVETRRGWRPAPILALGAAAIGLLVLIGYAYSQRALYSVGPFMPMALHSAVAFVLLAAAILVARMDRGLTAILIRPSPGGVLARRLLPAALALPFVLGWMGFAGVRTGLYPSEIGIALLVVGTIIAFGLLIVTTSWSLDRADEQRRRAEAEVHRLNRALEERVAERTGALERANGQLQEEAQIGADLARVGGELIASLDGSILLGRLCRVTKAVLRSDFSHVFLWNPEESVYVPVAQCGDTAEQWAALRPLKVPRALVARLLARLAEDGAVQVRMTEPQDLIPAALPAWYGITLTLYVALRRGDQIVGVLTAGYRGRVEGFSAAQERTAHGIAHVASLALETKRLFDQLEEANRLKSDFVSTMSHELRTPLHHIIGYTALLREGEFGQLTRAQVPVVGQLERSAHALLELVEQVLDLSRLEKENVALELRDVLLTDLARELEGFVRSLPNPANVRFAWHNESRAVRFRTDEAKLRVVLKSVLGNAFKFTGKGEIGVTVRESPEGIEFLISDTGIGIAPENHATIFEPFRQLEPHLTRRYSGVGLGLYIARRLLDALGGSITVESALGEGATFRISLPRGTDRVSLRDSDRVPWLPSNGSDARPSGQTWVGDA